MIILLKKFFAILFAVCVVTFASVQNSAEARDVYVGTSSATGWECYVMTETHHHLGDSDINVVTLKMIPKNGTARYLEYKMWYDFSRDVVRFSNAQGYEGIADRYETPIEWRMWRVITGQD